MITIEKRYERRTINGVEWTKWFKATTVDDDANAKEVLKQLKTDVKYIEKATGLKHEFRIQP